MVNHSSNTCQEQKLFLYSKSLIHRAILNIEEDCCSTASQAPKVTCHQLSFLSSPLSDPCSSAPRSAWTVRTHGLHFECLLTVFQSHCSPYLCCPISGQVGEKAPVFLFLMWLENSNHENSGFPTAFSDLLGSFLSSSQKAALLNK